MTIYTDDFSAYPVGSGIPAGWSIQWAAPSLPGLPVSVIADGLYADSPNAMEFGPNDTSFSSRILALNAAPTTDNPHAHALFESIIADETEKSVYGITICANDTETSSNGSAYVVLINPPNLILRKVSSGTNTSLDTVATNTIFTDDEINPQAVRAEMRRTVSGTDALIEAWVWPNGDPRPETPTLSYTDASPLAAGVSGVMSLMHSAANPVTCSLFSVTDAGEEPFRGVQAPSITLDNATRAPGQDVTGTANNFSAEPTTLSMSDGASPAYEPTPTFTANGDDWDFSATIEDFAADAKAAGEGVPVQGLIPGTITVTVE